MIILIAGPTGVGKTTLSKMLSRHYGCAYLSEDKLAEELFPDQFKKIEEFPDKLRTVQARLLEEISRNLAATTNVVIDLINLDDEFLERISESLNDRIILKVLYPSIETTIERDSIRSGWTSGESAIRRFYRDYEELKPVIGPENYLDNGSLTPEETLKIIIAEIANR